MADVQGKKTLQLEGFLTEPLLTESVFKREPIDTRFGQEIISEITRRIRGQVMSCHVVFVLEISGPQSRLPIAVVALVDER